MDTRKEGMTRREFLKRNILIIAALALFGSPLKAFAGVFKSKADGSNVSDKEGRYYRRLAG
ncbi:MAG: hypothetical protein PHX64_06100 [Candidatus Omnitrophica bacterium]|nr:hypothetical protein [Candidatus Omnitrophota bacterium]MDD5311307.1 hypothetical protein [Candidatus Omnitrophota bacterium]MDD5546929.1 hypothetical protein [Candidatus Omnitrophota bacterium]